jgi:hypothetical protein
MPSLFTAVISEIEGGDTFADAPLKALFRAVGESRRGGCSAALARRRSIRGTRSIAGAGCEWLQDALAIGFPASGKDV